MTTLTGSLLNLSSLLNGLSELGPVKRHLFRASREVLLAASGLLDFANQYVSGLSREPDRQEMVHSAIRYAQKTLRTIARQLPRGDEEEYRLIHRKVMSSILEVLDGEIGKSSKLKTQKSRMKVEVFEAIRNVLLKELYDPEEPREEGSHDHTG